MHTSSLTAAAPQMETSLESKFSAAFEQQISTSGGVGTNNHNNHHHHHHSNKSQMCNGSKSSKVGHHHNNHHHHQQSSQQQSSASSLMTTATPSTESTNGEKTVSFRKGNDLESFESLSSLFANGLFTDLVICCPGKMFKCHRVVMAAASLYIRDALSSFYNNNNSENESGGTGACNNCNTVLILPQEIKMIDMESILRFIYDGHVEVKVENIESFLRSARRLNIKGLSNVNIVYKNNGTTTTTDDSVNDNNGMQVSSATSTNTTRNNGYVKNSNSNNSNNVNSNNLLNGHAGMNSPPPSPPLSSPSLNSSLASLKAMTANQAHHHHPLANGNHHNLASKFLNGGLTSQLLNQYRNSLNKRDHSPLRNESSILGASNLSAGTNITPAHQNSTPKSIFNNGNLFSNNNSNNVRFDASNSSLSSSGSASRRKQKFPTNIPFITEMLPPTPATAQALYNTWLSMTSEDDEEDDLDDNDDDKRLIIKDDSSNDCGSTIGDNMSTTSMDSKQPTLPFGAIAPFAPQMPCMIEVEADPTTFPTYSDFNDSPTSSQQQQKRRRHFKSPFSGEKDKRMKLQQQLINNSTTNTNSNNSVDVSIKPTSPLIQTSTAATSQQSSPTELPLPKKPSSNSNSNSNNNSVRSSSLPPLDKPLFTAYSAMKTAAGANPAGSSPSSSSSASASGSWVGSKWKCDICNKFYGNKQTLKEHIDYFHSNREEQIYICNICNKEYTWRKSLMKHYRDIHQMRNTPALAEINRQLAAIASGKGQRPGMSPGSTTPGGSDSNQLQSYVSIANYPSTKKSTSMSKGSSDNSEKSNKSESEMENDNTNDAVPEDEDYGNDDIEIDGSCTTDADMHDETLNDDAKSESTSTTSPEKSINMTAASSPTPTKTDNNIKSNNEENEQNNNSNNNNNNGDTASAAEQSPASSLASS